MVTQRDLVAWTERDVREMCSHYEQADLDPLLEVARYTDTRLHSNRQALVDLLTTDSAPDWTTVSRVFQGRYDKPRPFIQARVLPALKVIRQNAAGFVETPVVQEITRCLDMWSQMHTMAEIVGTAGRSKSFACREWHLDHSESVYVDCPAVGGTGAFLREIARQIGAGIHGTLDALAESISTRMDRSNTLLVDEIARILPASANPHSAGVKALNFLQRLHDQQGVTIVFIATDIFDETFRDFRLEKYLAQLHRRILYRYAIPKVDKREIAAIVRAFNPQAQADLLNAALRMGSGADGIGPLFAYLQNAKMLADRRGEALGVDHLEEAAKYSRDRKTLGAA